MKDNHFEGIACFQLELELTRSPLSDKNSCLILESNSDPDYYAWQNFPPNRRQDHDHRLYLLLRQQHQCFQDIIFRNTQRFREQFGVSMHLYPGVLKFQHEDHQCIRIDISHIDELPALIAGLKKLDISLMKDKHVNKFKSTLTYKKFLSFDELSEGVYQDHHNSNRYFFRISRPISLQVFYKKMQDIKNSCNFHLFDAFLVEIMSHDQMLDFVGIYSEHCEKERFGDLKKELEKNLNQ